jgi:phenylalanyl-tRNA synthetase beta chain
MQISLKWINELVNINTVNLDYLIKKLTLGGFEVEDILEVEINNQKTTTLEISATANRSDSLSIQGISKEIAALLNKPYKRSKGLLHNLDWNTKIDKLLPNGCRTTDHTTFIGITIENLTEFTAPKWLTQKLIGSGITIKNNLLDFQNYILLETGYPFEFYDLDKIYSELKTSTFDLTIQYGNNTEQFLASNYQSYNIDNSTLIIKANDLSISIAGIITSKNVCYSHNTKSLLIEGSIFNSTKIRQQSRSLGLRTDRSARYEKSLKDISLLESLYRLVSLLRISNPSLICKLHTVNQPLQQKLKCISLHYQTINEILGPVKQYTTGNIRYIPTEMVTNYLNRLDFKHEYDISKKLWLVTIPYARSEDITREIDLIEEIGRLHGFNNFLTRLPKIKTIGLEDYSYRTRKKIISCFLNLGFNELIHYSLVDENTFIDNQIRLINPLLTDCSHLRISLLPSLIQTVQENLKQGNIVLEGFEYGHVFSGNVLTNFQEKEHIAGIFGGIKPKVNWSSSQVTLSWFEGKGKIEQFFKQLNLLTYWKSLAVSEYNQIFHPFCTAEVYLSDQTNLGIFGQIHPILAKRLNISSDLYLFEFDFESIQNQIQTNKLTIYQEYSLYPKIVKDLSFIINQEVSFETIQKILNANGSKFLTQINILDEYKGNSIPEKHLSICLQLVFQSNQKTLQNKEIERIINNLQTLLIKKFNVVIRL